MSPNTSPVLVFANSQSLLPHGHLSFPKQNLDSKLCAFRLPWKPHGHEALCRPHNFHEDWGVQYTSHSLPPTCCFSLRENCLSRTQISVYFLLFTEKKVPVYFFQMIHGYTRFIGVKHGQLIANISKYTLKLCSSVWSRPPAPASLGILQKCRFSAAAQNYWIRIGVWTTSPGDYRHIQIWEVLV